MLGYRLVGVHLRRGMICIGELSFGVWRTGETHEAEERDRSGN